MHAGKGIAGIALGAGGDGTAVHKHKIGAGRILDLASACTHPGLAYGLSLVLIDLAAKGDTGKGPAALSPCRILFRAMAFSVLHVNSCLFLVLPLPEGTRYRAHPSKASPGLQRSFVTSKTAIDTFYREVYLHSA